MKIFATYGIPRKIQSDNGPPFNSEDFRRFAEEEGFNHETVTPLHPRANGEAESFMRVINKTEQITALQSRGKSEREIAIQETLTAYRSTPHPATGVTPYQAMQNRDIRTKLDYKAPQEQINEIEMKISTRDAEYKRKMTEKKENRNFRETQLILGDYVLVKQPKRNKWSTAYEPTFYNVTMSQITNAWYIMC